MYFRSLITAIYVLFRDPDGSPSKIAVEVLLCQVYGDKKKVMTQQISGGSRDYFHTSAVDGPAGRPAPRSGERYASASARTRVRSRVRSYRTSTSSSGLELGRARQLREVWRMRITDLGRGASLVPFRCYLLPGLVVALWIWPEKRLRVLYFVCQQQNLCLQTHLIMITGTDHKLYIPPPPPPPHQ